MKCFILIMIIWIYGVTLTMLKFGHCEYHANEYGMLLFWHGSYATFSEKI